MIQEGLGRPERWQRDGRWYDPDSQRPYALDEEYLNQPDTWRPRQHRELWEKINGDRIRRGQVPHEVPAYVDPRELDKRRCSAFPWPEVEEQSGEPVLIRTTEYATPAEMGLEGAGELEEAGPAASQEEVESALTGV